MNNIGGSWRNSLSPWAPLALRLIVGYGFMAHGYAKLARGPETFAAILGALGVPSPHLLAWATVVVELMGGLAVLLGAFVSVASVPMAVVLIVAMFLPYGFSSIKLLEITAAGPRFGPPGYECNLLYLACLAALDLGGSGRLALDSLLKRHPSGKEQSHEPEY